MSKRSRKRIRPRLRRALRRRTTRPAGREGRPPECRLRRRAAPPPRPRARQAGRSAKPTRRSLRRSLLGPSDTPKGHCPICDEYLQRARADGLTQLAHDIESRSVSSSDRNCPPCSWPRIQQQFLASKGLPDDRELVSIGTSVFAEDEGWALATRPAHGVGNSSY
jgi:hypothetical protein